ncbi:hypothetical protein [Paenibacillus agilis]|uniref:Uncharacterized protein n=1 Tax=Paenibacillus agilis TaxID=3020863 RepID=A0A559IDJ9_9BACL|nr:hypothetical protein [Paenibacillus agilis]TVX85600.1 hypothetical protein FPZ44_24915 [Paenibacillus agilis]
MDGRYDAEFVQRVYEEARALNIRITETHSAYKAIGGWIPFNHITNELIPSISSYDEYGNIFGTLEECEEFVKDHEEGRI